MYQPQKELADFELEIEIDSLFARGPYRTFGNFIFAIIAYGYSEQEHAGPGTAYSRFNCRLKKDGSVLWSRSFESEKTVEPLKNQVESVQKLRNDYTTQLAESLSLTLKENIVQVIAHTNYYLRTQQSEGLRALSELEQQVRLKKSAELTPVPHTKVVLYRRNKKEQPLSLPVSMNNIDTVLAPSSYHIVSIPIEATELCSGNTCISIVPSARSTQYIECSLPLENVSGQVHFKEVKPKVGSFYVRQIRRIQATP